MAAGGTLGIMIPPSTIMVIYGIVTETNIGKLFAAGVIPGILTALALMIGHRRSITSRDPEHAPPGERTTWPDRWRALRGIWGVLLLVVVVLGGIYGGFFTATEGAGFGAARRLPVRAGAGAPDLGHPLRGAGRIGPHHGHAVHAADRRHPLRQLRQLHDDAGRPEGLDHPPRACRRSWSSRR